MAVKEIIRNKKYKIDVPLGYNGNKRIRHTFETIKDVYGRDCEINVFPAMPVSIAVETGRCWMKKAHPRLTIYDEKNGFKKALEIKYEGEDE